MDTLTLVPSNSYSVDIATDEVWSEALDGGDPRLRLNKIGAASYVNVRWLCSELDYKYLRAFHRLKTGRGSLPFEIGLILDEGVLETYKAKFVPNTLKIDSRDGSLTWVTATLSVTRTTAQDDALDEAFLDLYAAYGDMAEFMLGRLAKFANNDVQRLNY